MLIDYPFVICISPSWGLAIPLSLADGVFTFLILAVISVLNVTLDLKHLLLAINYILMIAGPS